MNIKSHLQTSLLLAVLLPKTMMMAVPPTTTTPQIVEGSDAFELTYRAKLPRLESTANLWLPFARSDDFQTVKVKKISTPADWQLIEDSARGNWIMAMRLSPDHSEQEVEIQYEVHRREITAYDSKKEDVRPYLQPERLVPINKTFEKLARQATQGSRTTLQRGQALYLHTLERMKYDKSGDGWGRGDAVYACDSRTGNCTDFHAYFIALCRAIKIPARFAIGFTIPADSDSGEIGGYHCWAEFHADGKWVPVDISEADKHPELTDYYFGHRPANRFEITAGRDLIVSPSPKTGSFNFLVYPYLENQEHALVTENTFFFRRIK